MANTILECPRRVSYAGSLLPIEQKSRRLSYAGQSNNILNQQAHAPSSSGKSTLHSDSGTSINTRASVADSANPNTAMLDGIIISRSMDVNRNLRRSTTSRSDDGFACSQQSILSAMDRFVKSVNNMDATVLVPSRLRDMDFDSTVVKGRPPVGFSNPDLLSFYSMLKEVKTELLWGSAMGAASSMLGPLAAVSGRSTPRQHTRQPSDDSMGSTGSASDQDTDSDLDSVLTDRDTCSVDEQTSHIAVAFRYHLQGLHSILHQLADSADYLAARYQAEVDSSSL